MRSSTRVKLGSFLAVLALAAPGYARPADRHGADRVIERTFPAAKLRELRLKGNVGDIRVATNPEDQVVLRLTLRAKEHNSFWGDPEKAKLEEDLSGDHLKLSLDADDRDGLEERWELKIPARLAVNLEVGVGDIEVNGVAGGLELKVGVGDVRLDVPQGDLRAEVGVGDIKATTATRSYGRVDLRSSVGGTRLEVGGKRVREEDQPGFSVGSHVSMSGNGKDSIRLAVSVGDASLTVRSAI